MSNKVKIAIDAMGGENAPKKIIEGINISLKSNQENFFYLYGQEDLLKKEVSKSKLLVQNCEIINTKDIILDNESPLTATIRGKKSDSYISIIESSCPYMDNNISTINIVASTQQK